MKRVSKVMTAALVLLATITVAAQDSQPAAPQSKPPAPTPVSLKVSLVFSRYQGDKKISSVPHTLWVTTGERTSLRLGTQIPVPTTLVKEGVGVQSYNYRDVGTNIDCSAAAVLDGAYRLGITITDSSVYYPDQSDPAVRSSIDRRPGIPQFQLDVHNRAQGRPDGTVHLGDRPGQRPGHQARRDPKRSEIVGEFVSW